MLNILLVLVGILNGVRATGYEYFIPNGNSTWLNAHEACKNEGGWLAAARTAAEQDEISKLDEIGFTTSQPAWIGLHRECGDYHWVAFDGDATSSAMRIGEPQPWYTSFEPNNAAAGDQSCIVLLDKWTKWNDEQCHKNYRALCARLKAGDVTTKKPTIREPDFWSCMACVSPEKVESMTFFSGKEDLWHGTSYNAAGSTRSTIADFTPLGYQIAYDHEYQWTSQISSKSTAPLKSFQFDITFSHLKQDAGALVISVADMQSSTNISYGNASMFGPMWNKFVGISVILDFEQDNITLIHAGEPLEVPPWQCSSSKATRKNCHARPLIRSFITNEKIDCRLRVENDTLTVELCKHSNRAICIYPIYHYHMTQWWAVTTYTSRSNGGPDVQFKLFVGAGSLSATKASNTTLHSVVTWQCFQPYFVKFLAAPKNTFFDAFDLCESAGGTLANIKSDSEFIYSKNYFPSYYTSHIGLYTNCDGVWHWTDGTTFDESSRFVSNASRNVPQMCSLLRSTGFVMQDCYTPFHVGVICSNSKVDKPKKPEILGCPVDRRIDFCENGPKFENYTVHGGKFNSIFDYAKMTENNQKIELVFINMLAADVLSGETGVATAYWSKKPFSSSSFEIYSTLWLNFSSAIDGFGLAIASRNSFSRYPLNHSLYMIDWPHFTGFSWLISSTASDQAQITASYSTMPGNMECTNTTTRWCWSFPASQEFLQRQNFNIFKLRFDNLGTITSAYCRSSNACFIQQFTIPNFSEYAWQNGSGESFYLGILGQNHDKPMTMYLGDYWVHECPLSTTTTSTTSTSTTSTTSTQAHSQSAEIELQSLSSRTMHYSSVKTFDSSDSAATATKMEEIATTPSFAAQFSFFAEDRFIETTLPKVTTEQMLIECGDFSSNMTAPPKFTKVRLTFAVDKFLGIDTLEQTIGVGATVFLSWKVDTCSSSIKSGSEVTLPVDMAVTVPENVWRPDWRFLTAASSNTYVTEDESGVYGQDILATWYQPPESYNRTFTFYWLRGGAYHATCTLDLRSFPFDTQTCIFTFALRRSTGLVAFEAQKIQFLWPGNHTEDGAEWEFQKKIIQPATITYRGMPTSAVHFSVTLKRNPGFYVTYLIFPTAVLASIQLFTFILPPHQPERPAQSMTILLAVSFSQTFVTRQVPKTSQNVMLVDYVSFLSWMCSACLIYQMMACYCAHLLKEQGKGRFCCGKLSFLRFTDLIVVSAGVVAFILIHLIGMKAAFGF